VEALLGVRMPRRSVFTHKDPTLWERLEYLLTDGNTWNIVAYMVLQFPLGIIYFCLLITLIALGLSGPAIPLIQEVFNLPVARIAELTYFIPSQIYLLTIVAGGMILPGVMHLAKLPGKFYGWLARALPISKQ